GGIMNEIAQALQNSYLVKVIAAVVEMVIGFFLGPFVKRQIMRLHNQKGVDEGVLTFTGSLANTAIRFTGFIIALGQLGVDMSVIVGAFSAVGLGVSLALKENMSNVASGMQILITKPFKVGDYIACDGLEGTVMAIEIMFTTLKTVDNQQAVIPNAILISQSVVNYSLYPTRRINIIVPISALDDYEGFRLKAKDIMDEQSGVLADPAPKTVVGTYTQDGRAIQIKLVCYAQNANYWDTYYALTNKIEVLRKEIALHPPVDLIQVVQPQVQPTSSDWKGILDTVKTN
ncbi:MAG: mechanosensitive ion channel family protein, partial [Allobaculum sp.]|nr:mechanosensitive ion channel family protein [Allobaculum sp.]